MTDSLEATCAAAYRDVHRLWSGLEGTLATWHHKFSILYGPPRAQPPFFVVGFNPGGGADQELEISWPAEFWYARASNPLCRVLQRLFERAGQREAFARSTGANLIFFRTPGIPRRGDGTGWRDIPEALRDPLERFCRSHLDRMIDAMRPKVLVVMGWDALERMVPVDADRVVLECGGHWLAVPSQYRGRPLIAIKHPSARARSRWTDQQIEEVGTWLHARLPSLLA